MTSRPIYGSGMLDLRPDVDPKEVEKFKSDFSSKMGKVGKAVGTALVAGVTAAVAAGSAAVMAAIGQEATGDKAAARLGLSEADAARLGTIAGTVYKDNFGESMAEVQTVAADVWKRFGDVGDDELERVTAGALTLADVFDVDVTEVLQAAQEQFANGLAPTAEESLDIVAAALQGTKGPTDEILAALNEYSDHFAQIGLDAPNIIGALTSEWSTNMYAIDKVGDAVKEFGIRVIDGSELTKTSLESIGFSVDDVNAAFAEGGPAAEQMTTDIISAITAIEDPAERAKVGVGLMGTPFEDLGKDAVPILNDLVEGVDEFGGSTGKVADQAYDNIQNRLSGAWRTVSQTVVEKVGKMILPHMDKITRWATEKLPALIQGFSEWLPGAISTASSFITGTLVPAFQMVVGWVQKIVEWWQNLSPESKKLVGDLAMGAAAAVAAAVAAHKLVAGFKAVSAAFKAMRILMAANPWLLLIAAVVALVVLIVQNWDKITAFLQKTWDWIKSTAGAVWQWLKDTFKKGLKFVTDLFLNWTLPGLLIKHWDKIKEGVREVIGWVKDRWNDLIGWFRELPGRVSRAISGLFNGLKNAFKDAVNWVIRKWNDFRLEIQLPGILGGGTIGIDTPNIPLFDDGGIADPAPGRSHMLAILKRGERVLTEAQNETLESQARGVDFGGATFKFYGLPREIVRQLGTEVSWQMKTAGV